MNLKMKVRSLETNEIIIVVVSDLLLLRLILSISIQTQGFAIRTSIFL